ncbi:hypothetical protein AHF37_02981 [Paragonimus kellicotti]|nr:hypothetical protein AHF37_02981 [Paragonimus kellicotti]
MVSLPGQPFFKLANLTVQDSGMYMCKNRSQTGSDYAIVMDYYIIVLPRNEDVSVIFSTLPVLETDKLEDAYPYTDVLNRSYIYEPKSLYVSCIYLLSNGLDNHDGFQSVFFSGSSKQNHALFRKFRRDLGEFSVYVLTYQINLVTNPKTEANLFFECSYVYKPVFHLLRNSRPVPPELARITQRRWIIHVPYSRPLIIASSIDTSSTSITEQLKRSSLVLEDLYTKTSIEISRVNVMEGVISGSFVGLLHEFRGWGSVVTYSKNTNQTTFSVVQCSTNSQKIMVHENDSLWKAEEMSKSQTLIARRFHFQCTLSLETILLVFSVFNSWQEAINQNLVAWSAHQRLYTMFGGNQTYVDLSVDYPRAAVYGAFKIAVIQVGWIGTVYPGNPIKMLWPVGDQEIRELRCIYSMSVDSPPTKVNLGFLAQKLTTVSMYQLAKRNASEEDSGLYYCTTCLNCSSVAISEARRLVVLPDASRLQMSVLHGNATHSGSGSPDDPIRTKAESVFIRCSCMIYGGLLTKFDLVVTYETGIPNSTEHLPLHASQKVRQSGSQDAYYRLSVSYELEKPTENVYWNYTRVNCSMRLFNLTKDPHDLTKNVTSHVITKSLYFSYEIVRQPILFPLLIETTSDALTSGLRRDQAADISKAFSAEEAPAVRELAGVYEIEYTMFMGLPAGWTQVWVVYKSENDGGTLTCPRESSVPIRSPEEVPGLASTKTYTSNGGLNFVRHKFACLLDIDRFVLIVVAFGNVKHEENRDAMEKLLKQRFSNWLLSRQKNMSLLTIYDKVAMNNVSIIYRIIRLDIIWKASVTIGQRVFMLGERPVNPSAEVSCFYKANEADEFGTVPTEFVYNKSEPTRWFRATIAHAKYWNSGIYKCNLTNDRSKSLPRIVLAPRELVVLPTSSILILHLNHKPIIPNTLSKPNFTQYLPSGTPFLKAEQHASVRCIYLESPIQRLKTKLHIVYEMFDTKRAKYVSLAVFDPVNFKIRTRNFVFTTGSRMIKAPDVMSYKGSLRVTCRLIYRPGVIPHDQALPIHTKLITQEKHIQLNVNTNPYIFPSYIHSEKSGLLDSLSKMTVNEMNAITFHQSGTQQILEEDIVTFRCVQTLGVPKGFTHTWTIYQHNNQLNHDVCTQIRLKEFKRDEIPLDLRTHDAYTHSGGRNFINVTFSCALQPRHLALVFAVFNMRTESSSYSDKNQTIRWHLKVIKSITNNVRFWLNNPDSSEQLGLTPLNTDLNVAWVVIKLKIGWKASVRIGESWRILVHGSPSPGVSISIYYQESETSPKVLWNRQPSMLTGLFIGSEKASYNHSGIYSCVMEGTCEDCTLNQCFLPRRLYVLPDTSMLKLYLNHRRFSPNEKLEDDIKIQFLDTGEEAFVYCVYIRPKGFDTKERLRFKYELTSTSDFANKSLSYKPLDSRFEKVTYGTIVIAPYHIIAPKTPTVTSTLVIECSLKFGTHNYDPNDLSSSHKQQELTATRQVTVRLRLGPKVYTQFLGSSDMAFRDWIRSSFAMATSPLLFHQRSSLSDIVMLEKVTDFGICASHGWPKGWIYTMLFLIYDTTILREPCVLVQQQSLSEHMLPIEFLRDPEYDPSRSESIVLSYFQCLFRKENIALATIVYNVPSSINQTLVLDESIGSLTDWLHHALDNPSEGKIEPPKTPEGAMVTYMIAKLNVVWTASMPIGFTVEMYGYRQNYQDFIDCLVDQRGDDSYQPVDETFTINGTLLPHLFQLRKREVEYSDTGFYLCSYHPANCTECYFIPTIVKRQLIVLPDMSVVHMFITHDKLGLTDEWTGNFTHCDRENRPVLYTSLSAYAHCRHKLPFTEWLQLTVTFKLYIIRNSNARKLIPATRTEPLSRPGEYALHSYMISLQPDDEYGSELQAVCEWEYKFPSRVPNDVRQETDPIILNRSRIILVRVLIPPQIHNQYTVSNNLTVQGVIKRAYGNEQNAVLFHSRSRTIVVAEQQVQLHLLFTLGVPRGQMFVWTVYEYANRLYKEPCWLTQMVNLTQQVIPAELQRPGSRIYREMNVVNASFSCSFRAEQLALFIHVYTVQEESDKHSEVSSILTGALLATLKHWIDNPRSTQMMRVTAPKGVLLNYRIIKLLIRWPNSVNVGARIKILGHIPMDNPQPRIQCFYLRNNSFEFIPQEHQFHVINTNDNLGFYFIKPSAEFYDTGVYLCNVTNAQCANCTSEFGFIPRSLTVIPDASFLQIYLNHKLTDLLDRNFTQCTEDHKPYLLLEQSAFVFCTYKKPISSTIIPLHSFKVSIMTRNQTNVSEQLKATFVRQEYETRDTHEVITQAYRIQAPAGHKINGPLRISCTISYPNSSMAWSRRRTVEIVTQIRPFIFEDYISTSRQLLTDAFKHYLKSVPTSAVAFFNTTKPFNMHLEGKVRINFTVGLGKPNGWAGVDLLYMDKGLIRRKRCPQVLLDSFADGSVIPKHIKDSTYYKDSGGYGLVKYTVNCTLTLNVVAMLILAMNGFSPRLSSVAQQHIFYSSVFDTLQYWFAQPNLSISIKSIMIPSGSYVSYGLFALNVGWRASVFVGDPIIMVGLMLPGLTGHLHCYYYEQAEKSTNRRELHIDKYSLFINRDPKKQLFEVIKPVASMTDSGMYDCVLSSCPTCIALKLLVPHYLTVTPRHIDGSVHYSLKPVRSHSENHTVWNFDQTINANGTKFIYATQLVRVICDYHLPIGTTTQYNIQLSYSKLSKRNQSIQHLFFEEEYADRVRTTSYLAVYSVYRITGPTDSFLTDILETKCRLQLSRITHTQSDVNRVSEEVSLNRAHTLLVRTWITPFIYSDTIQTDNKVITHAFRSAPKRGLNGAQFLRDYERYKVVEGPLKITYVRSPSVPNGWSGVFSIYNRSQGFVAHACVLDYEHYIRRNTFDSSQHLRPEVSEENQYICLLLPKQIGLLIYTVHYPQNGRNRSHFENYFLPHVANVIETWFQERASTRKSIKFEINAGGDYRLIPVHVRWTGTIKLGDPLQMYGLISHNNSHTVDCFHGLRSAVEPLQGFTLERNHTMGYFLLRKLHVQMADTGVYVCMAPRGAKYTQPVGFEQRELTVLPDSSILELLVERVQSSRSNRLPCQLETLGILMSEDRLLITCSNILYHSRFTAFQHIIVHGFMTDDKTHNRLSRLTTKIVKNRDGTEMFQSRATLQLPRISDQYSEWFVRCELSHQVPQDAPEDRSADKAVGGELSTEKFYYVFNLRDPSIKDYRIQYWVSNSVDDTDSRFVDVDNYEHMKEGEYKITFTALLGFPQGWTFIRTFYVQDNQQIQPDRCGDLPQIYQNRADDLLKQHPSSCILQPEHIAILMVVVSLTDTSLEAETVEYQLENLFLQNLTADLYPNSPSTTDKLDDAAHCFRFDHRLIRLRISWRATVNTGEPIRMQGTLAWREVDSLLCLVRNRRTGAEKPLPDSFTFIRNPDSEQFFLIKQHASPHDTGIYLCRAESETDSEIYVGMQPRTLIVLPTQAVVGCELTLDQAGLNHVNLKQRLPDGTIYLLSRQVGFVQCRFARVLGQIYTVTYHLIYQMRNDMNSTKEMIRMFGSETHLSEQGDTETIRRVYQITSPRAEDYTGLLQVGCLSRFENLTTDHDILDWTGSFEVSCSIWFTIQEAANGNLSITSLSRNFAEQPVPLGSEFLCSGGQGMPRLTYNWTRIKSELYGPQTNDQTDLAMILPADGGGWGGPTQPFVDMPLKDLEIVGPLLRVPEDFSYRGMSYMYMCVGKNNILGVEHSIKKTIHLSILICPTDRESMDLTIFFSPRLMSACRFTHNPHPDMQYFGYYYVTLIRQLVLALPYGSNRTRFTFIHREKSNLSTFSWTRFDPRLDKKLILKRLYSRTAKPTSGQATCSSRLTSLTETLRSVNQVYAAGFVNNPVLLLTVDNFLLVDYGPELVGEVNKLKQIGVKIILALTHPQGGTFREFNDNLIRILDPFATLNILPYFEGTHKCDSCQFGLEERRPRIRRAELFDQLCQASGSQLPAPIESPKLTYSLPDRHRFPGLHLLVTCTEATVDWANPQMITQLDICLSNQTEASKLNRSMSTVQQLSKACHRHLSIQQYLPNLKTSVRERKGFTNMIIIREIAEEPLVLCFQRLGEKDPSLFDAVNFTLGSVYGHEFPLGKPSLYIEHWPKFETQAALFRCAFRGFQTNLELFDAVNFTLGSVYGHEFPLGKPSLYIEHWPKFETQAALFRCAFRGFQTNLEVLLLVYSGNHINSNKFFILSRCRPNLIGDDNITTCNMMWLELSTKQRPHKEFRCLFRPINRSTTAERFLSQLPTTSESVQYSDSLNIPQIYSDCPKAPDLQVNPRDTEPTIVMGSRLEFQCRTSGTSRNEPVKLFFLAPSFYFILCFRTRTVANVYQNSCFFTSLDDKDCTNEVQKDPIYATLYQTDCVTEAARLGTPDIHTIYFSIPKLRSEDFGSAVFCQTVSLYSLGTTEDFFMQTMMTSDIHVIRFRLEPQITAFHYDRTRQIWKCSAAAFPLIHLAQIRVIRAQPMWLGKQLATYTSSAHHVKRPPQQFETILPGVPYERLEFMEEISFHPVLSRTGGLTHGIVELQCSFGKASRRLITKIGSQDTKYEPILPALPIRHYGQVITMVCTLNSPEANPVQTVRLHKWMRTYWLTYDLTVLTIVLYSKGSEDNLFGLHSWQIGFKLFGLWNLNRQPQIRVLSDHAHGVLSLGISILFGTEFDSGSYFCSGRSVNNLPHQSGALHMEVIQGIQKQIAFGYRLVNVGKRWTKYNQTANLHEPIHLRCVLWTTNPTDRNVDQVGLSLKQVTPKVNRTIFTPPGQTTIVLRMIEHYESAELDTEMNLVECFAKVRQSKAYYATIDGPKVVCRSSAHLSARPFKNGPYERSTVIECFTNSSCSSVSFRWLWLAGPVPPVTIETYDWHHMNYSHGRFLYLAALPRGGTYLFRCVAQCRCGINIFSLTFTHQITVDYNFDDMELLESSDPGDVELKEIVQGQSGENRDTLESSIERWEQSESEPFVSVETEQHTSVMPRPSQPIPTEHIAINETRIMYQPEYPKNMSEETFRDISNGEFLENLDHYALRRISDNYVRVVTPEKQFVRMDPDGKGLFPEPESRHDDSYLADKLETLKRIDQTKRQFHQMRTHGSGKREGEATYHRTWPSTVEHINEFLDKAIDKNEKQKIFLSSRRTSVLDYEGNLTLSQLATDTATRFLKTDIKNWSLLKRKQLSKRRILHLNSDKFDFERNGSSRYALTLALNTGIIPNDEMLDKAPGYSQRDHEDVSVEFVEKTGNNIVLSEKPPFEERVMGGDRLGSRKPYISRSLINDKQRTYSDQVRMPMHIRWPKRETFDPIIFVDYGSNSYLDSRDRTGNLGSQELFNLTRNANARESSFRKQRRDRHFEILPRLFYPSAKVHDIEPESLRSAYQRRTRFRDYDPTERLDVNVYEKDRLERKTPWWTRLPHGQTLKFIRQGVTSVHHVHSPGPRTFQPNESRDSDDPVGWTRYLNHLRDHISTQFISPSESDTREKLKENAFSNEVRIKPGFVILPGSTTVMCPSLLPNKNSSYYLSTLEWYRCANLNEQKQKILGISLDQRRLYLGSNRYQNSTRVYAYPPLRWTHTHTLDIDRLHISDYGFYGCVNWYLSDSLEKIAIKSQKISSHPLCLMSKQTKPKLKIWRSEELTLQQMYKWLTPKNGTDSLKVEQTERTGNRTGERGCLKPGEKLIVVCMVNSYRLFCDRTDEIAGGLATC